MQHISGKEKETAFVCGILFFFFFPWKGLMFHFAIQTFFQVEGFMEESSPFYRYFVSTFTLFNVCMWSLSQFSFHLVYMMLRMRVESAGNVLDET